jgi:hypothetical protein
MNSIVSTKTISWHVPFEIIETEGFLTIEDLINLLATNKYYNKFYKRLYENKLKKLNNLYNILQKCKSVIIKDQRGHRYILNNISPNEYYTSDYWNDIFGNQLCPDELAIYYSYFANKYNYSMRQLFSETEWACSIFRTGFIKCFPSKLDGSIPMIGDYNDHDYSNILKITSYIDINNGYIHNTGKNLYNKTEIHSEAEHTSPIDRKIFNKIHLVFYYMGIDDVNEMTFKQFYKILISAL